MHVLSFSATLTPAQSQVHGFPINNLCNRFSQYTLAPDLYSVRLPVAYSIVITGQKCTLSVIQRHIQASVLPRARGLLSV